MAGWKVMAIERFLNTFVRLLFPPKCIFCGKVLNINVDIEICVDCLKEVSFIDDTDIKSRKFWSRKNWYDGVICVYQYNSIVKRSIIRYKFYNRSSYYRTFGKILADRIRKAVKLSEFDLIMSVPLHKNKERKRGYNQSLLISKVLSKELGLRESSKLLIRLKDTGSQSLLDRKGRLDNLRGAFKVCSEDAVRNKKILLVDDVMTTGSTIDECSKVLKKAGAVKVVAAVIATGRKY